MMRTKFLWAKTSYSTLEMARDVAGRINNKVGREVLIEPEALTNAGHDVRPRHRRGQNVEVQRATF